MTCRTARRACCQTVNAQETNRDHEKTEDGHELLKGRAGRPLRRISTSPHRPRAFPLSRAARAARRIKVAAGAKMIERGRWSRTQSPTVPPWRSGHLGSPQKAFRRCVGVITDCKHPWGAPAPWGLDERDRRRPLVSRPLVEILGHRVPCPAVSAGLPTTETRGPRRTPTVDRARPWVDGIRVHGSIARPPTSMVYADGHCPLRPCPNAAMGHGSVRLVAESNRRTSDVGRRPSASCEARNGPAEPVH